MVEHGIISSIKDHTAVIRADSGIMTLPLNIPDRFINVDEQHRVKPGQGVIFAYFEDGTGSILERM